MTRCIRRRLSSSLAIAVASFPPASLSLDASLRATIGPLQPLSATSSHCSPRIARSAIARRSATIRTSRVAWRSTPMKRFWRELPARKWSCPGMRPRASWHAGWPRLTMRRRMPLDDKPLPETQRDLIRRWIDPGRHEAYQFERPRRQRPGSFSTASAACGRALAGGRVADRNQARAGTWNAKAGGALSVSLLVGPLPAVSALALRGDERLLAVGTYGAGHTLGSERRLSRRGSRGSSRGQCTPWRLAATAAGWPSAGGCRRDRAWCGFIPFPMAR